MKACNYENAYCQIDGYHQNAFIKVHLIAYNYGQNLEGHEMGVHKVIYRYNNFRGKESFVVLAFYPAVRNSAIIDAIKVLSL